MVKVARIVMSSVMTMAFAFRVRVFLVYVYEWPVRAWYFLNAIGIIVLSTGYYMATAPSRCARRGHCAVLHGLCLLRARPRAIWGDPVSGRLYWAIMGNHYARHPMFPALFNAGCGQRGVSSNIICSSSISRRAG